MKGTTPTNKSFLTSPASTITKQREKEHMMKKEELNRREKILQEQYDKMQSDLLEMSKKQEKMLKLQSIRQQQHKLEIEEQKI